MKIICKRSDKAKIIALLVPFIALFLFEFIVFYYRPFSLANAPATQNKTIVIDAGHGGFDGGATSDSGILEKDINLKIAKKLKCVLSTLGFNTVMTRENEGALAGDKKNDMYKRLEIIKSVPNSIFISIHQNHFSQEKYSGAQVFYGSACEEQSKRLAQILQANLKANLNPQNNREIKKAYSSLFLFKKAPQPCVLVECGFLSNNNETELLCNDEYQTKIAVSIAKSILEYYQI